MKRLILCFDGTWEARASLHGRVGLEPTNVEKTQIAISKVDVAGNAQVTKYYAGIGTARGSRLFGGATGFGISATICDAYAFVVDNFIVNEDELFIFGFSRGAYTARSLCGFLQWLGAIDKGDINWLPECYRLYLRSHVKPKPPFAGKPLQIISTREMPIPVRFLGVWDTVGALGVPFPLIGRMLNRPFVGFHDTALSKNVSHAFHALAIHERRTRFEPLLWTAKAPGQEVQQAWFPGSHCDVGGGNPQDGLSNATLLWMLCHAARLGLALDLSYVGRLTPDHRSDVYNSSRGRWRPMPTRVRSFSTGIDECLHSSAGQRLNYLKANPPRRYLRKWRLADAASSSKLVGCLECLEIAGVSGPTSGGPAEHGSKR